MGTIKKMTRTKDVELPDDSQDNTDDSLKTSDVLKGMAMAVKEHVWAELRDEVKSLTDSILVRVTKALNNEFSQKLKELEAKYERDVKHLRQEVSDSVLNSQSYARTMGDAFSSSTRRTEDLIKQFGDVHDKFVKKLESIQENGLKQIETVVKNLPAPEATFVLPEHSIKVEQDAPIINPIIKVDKDAFKFDLAIPQIVIPKIEPKVVVQPSRKRTVKKTIEYDKDTNRPSTILEEEEG